MANRDLFSAIPANVRMAMNSLETALERLFRAQEDGTREEFHAADQKVSEALDGLAVAVQRSAYDG